jgi:hypothetical protein
MALRQQHAARLKKIPNLALRDGRRILSNLGGGVPKRHVERADRDAALPVTARLFSGHHYLPCAKGVEIGPRRVDKLRLARPQQPRRETTLE